MKLWHPQRFLYYHRLSTKVHKAISKIVEVNDSMPTEIKYKPWEILESSIKSQSKSKSIIKENSKDNNNIDNKDNNVAASNVNINNENHTISNSPSKDDDKNKIINISLDTLKQTIVISTEDIPLSSSNNNSKDKVKVEDNKDTTNDLDISNKQNSSVSLFSENENIDIDEENDLIDNEKENNDNKTNDEIINENKDSYVNNSNEDKSNVDNSNDNINKSENSSFDDLNLDDHDVESNIYNSKISIMDKMKIMDKINTMDKLNALGDNNNKEEVDNSDNNNVSVKENVYASYTKNDTIPNDIEIESYYKLPMEVDIHIQSLLEELPQFTWKVDGEFIGDCDSFFEYIKNSYGYQIHMDDDMLEDIANEDINIQKYHDLNVPVVFSTSNDLYFKNIPHLSETTNNVSLDYIKKNGTHLTIKKFRHHLNNTLDDIKYDDYINKAYYKKDYSSGSLNYSDLEIDSEDLDELINDDNYIDENDKEDYIRSPICRYHRYVIDGNGNTAGSISHYSNESLITPVNSKYTPSTKPQSNSNPKNDKGDVESPEINKTDNIDNNDTITNDNTINNIDNSNNVDNVNNYNNIVNNNTDNEEDDINYSYKGENSFANDDLNNTQLSEQLSNNEVIEQIENPDNINEVNKDDIVEEIVTENIEEITTQEQPINNNEENVLSKGYELEVSCRILNSRARIGGPLYLKLHIVNVGGISVEKFKIDINAYSSEDNKTPYYDRFVLWIIETLEVGQAIDKDIVLQNSYKELDLSYNDLSLLITDSEKDLRRNEYSFPYCNDPLDLISKTNLQSKAKILDALSSTSSSPYDVLKPEDLDEYVSKEEDPDKLKNSEEFLVAQNVNQVKDISFSDVDSIMECKNISSRTKRTMSTDKQYNKIISPIYDNFYCEDDTLIINKKKKMRSIFLTDDFDYLISTLPSVIHIEFKHSNMKPIPCRQYQFKLCSEYFTGDLLVARPNIIIPKDKTPRYTHYNILMLGTSKNGKTSLINSILTLFNNRVTLMNPYLQKLYHENKNYLLYNIKDLLPESLHVRFYDCPLDSISNFSNSQYSYNNLDLVLSGNFPYDFPINSTNVDLLEFNEDNVKKAKYIKNKSCIDLESTNHEEDISMISDQVLKKKDNALGDKKEVGKSKVDGLIPLVGAGSESSNVIDMTRFSKDQIHSLYEEIEYDSTVFENITHFDIKREEEIDVILAFDATCIVDQEMLDYIKMIGLSITSQYPSNINIGGFLFGEKMQNISSVTYNKLLFENRLVAMEQNDDRHSADGDTLYRTLNHCKTLLDAQYKLSNRQHLWIFISECSNDNYYQNQIKKLAETLRINKYNAEIFCFYLRNSVEDDPFDKFLKSFADLVVIFNDIESIYNYITPPATSYNDMLNPKLYLK
ncbi:hypothetical protein PIROE2DRAFT_61489 [Piromyces sp. E2]|nr:hypothetical protein PIROE2DRAFT_61489 [Piromyces sp. E2]|eukprot:OUM63098.1 hypothetical protein PIROE2DRAFT_61489 [Piromyces sp. E2]